MKRINLYLSALALTVMATACHEDFDTPPMVVPVAQHTPNMTLQEFKEKYWDDARNFCTTIEEDVVIHGWVSANDESGNIYKHMYIQDETAGLGISIDANSLYTTYRVGQEIVINMKGGSIGKYNGEYLIGKPEWYAAQSVWEAGRMPLDDFKAMAELNGLPNASKIAPVVTKISDVVGKNDAQTQVKYQGQLVMFENVEWEGADGELPYAESGSTITRKIKDADGNTLDVTNSGYSNWYASPMPLGKGNVVGVLYLTGADAWKLYLRDTNDCIGFANNTKGIQKDPYTIAEALELMNSGTNGWVTGYIVGAVAPEVTEVKSNADVEFKAPTTLDNTLVIGETPDTKDIAHCLVVALPQGTPFRSMASLKNFPELLGSQILVKGEFATFMGTNGITGNSGAKDEFKLSMVTGGVTNLEEGFNDGLPADWTQVQVQGDKKWYQTTFNDNGYAAMTGYKGTAPFDSWLITPAIDIKNAPNKTLSFRTQVNGYGSTTTKFEVYVMSSDDPTSAEMVQLSPTIATAPASGYSEWAQSGDIDLSAYDGTYFIGFRYVATSDANYATWCVDDVSFGNGKPPVIKSETEDDFETIKGGDITGGSASLFETLTSERGWVATNSALLKGGDADNNPVFKFIGYRTGTETYAFAVYMNGGTDKKGSLHSPTLKNGIGTLEFNYGLAMTDRTLSFHVAVMQNGQEVWGQDVTEASPVVKSAYAFSAPVNVKGDFTITFTPLSPSNATGNKDRIAIWNVHWTSNE